MSKWYGSLQNRIIERSAMPKPEVGMGVTEICYSDRNPYEIVEVIDDRHIMVRRLDYKRIDSGGFSEDQEYEYFSNEEYPLQKLFLTKQGQWRMRIGRNGLGSWRYSIGHAEKYWDPHF